MNHPIVMAAIHSGITPTCHPERAKRGSVRESNFFHRDLSRSRAGVARSLLRYASEFDRLRMTRQKRGGKSAERSDGGIPARTVNRYLLALPLRGEGACRRQTGEGPI